ncbi:MAG: helix-turn-helix domain-containing protein [Oscillospiraceae bacterium]|nr:helix-turn-helix domain-containing protein [Oscillospiraceae bacterium]
MKNSQIAERVKTKCKEKGLSVAQLLRACGITKSFIYDLEKRDTSPSCERIAKIADHLGCSVDYLLGRTDNPDIAQ